MAKAPCPPCLHAEAFCLMDYGTGASRKRLWNARDGVTPFYLTKDRKHERWALDDCDPWHRPQLGDQVFIDLTPKRAIEYARSRVERWWDLPLPGWGTRMSDRYASKEEAVLALGQIENPGEPDVLVLESEWQIVAVCAAARAQATALGLDRALIDKVTRARLQELKAEVDAVRRKAGG